MELTLPDLTFNRRPTENLAAKLHKKKNPLQLTDLTLGDLIFVVTGQRKMAQSLEAFTKGDIQALSGVDTRQLEQLPGIGEGGSIKIAALFELIRRATE